MRILVTGGTGFIGSHSGAALARDGHELRWLVRDPAKLVGPGEVVQGDITDERSVRAALAGCDAVLHAAAAVSIERRHAARAFETNTAGARVVLGTAVALGLERIVYVSSTSALDGGVGRPYRVESPLADGRGYGASKAAAEAVARELQAAAPSVHISYPVGVIGPAANESLGEASRGIAQFVAAGVIPTRRGALSLVDVRDLADVHRRLFACDAPPPRVLCGGTALTLPELAVELRALTGRRFPVVPTPPTLLRGLGRIVDGLAAVLPIEPALTHEAMDIVTRWPGTIDNTAELGVHYRPIRETLADALDAWQEAGLIATPAPAEGR